jgi:hypothetical protein
MLLQDCKTQSMSGAQSTNLCPFFIKNCSVRLIRIVVSFFMINDPHLQRYLHLGNQSVIQVVYEIIILITIPPSLRGGG